MISSTRRIQRCKSPRSVLTFPSPDTGYRSFSKPGCDDACPSASTLSLLKLNRAVRIWRCHSLDSRNRSQKQRNSRRVRKTVSFPKNPSSTTRVREFDHRESVLSVSDPSHVFTEDLIPQTPWYDEEYEEMPWWEYPDLDEDDEITVLCKKVARNQDPAYVDRVEALVWTAVVKLQNVACFALQQKEQTPNQKTASAKTNIQSPAVSQTQPKAARAEIPSMFMGLPRQVQAEKRRYRRSSNEIDMPEKPTVTNPQVQDTQSAVPAPRPVRTIRRTVATSAQKKNEDITPTPAAVFVRVLANTAPLTTASPKVYSSPANATKMRIQKLKEQQQALKEEQERVNKKKMEEKEATQRLEAQQRRLERLRNRSMSS